MTSLAAGLPGHDELLVSIVEATRERLGAVACSVAVLDGDELEFRAASGVGAAEVLGLRIPASHGIAGWVATSGQAITVSDVDRDGRFARDTAESTGYVPRTILAVPVETDDEVWGVLEVLDRDPGSRDTAVAVAAARQVALLLVQARVFAEVAGMPVGLVAMVRDLAALDDGDRALVARLFAAVVEHVRAR